MNNFIDPIDLVAKIEKIVCDGNKRKYLRFGTTPDYGTGVATAYTTGCNLRCIFCWASETRDNLEISKSFYSPEDVFEILQEIVKKNPKIDKVRISDGEPTIGRNHLLELIELVEKSGIGQFILETNGTLLGNDESYIKDLSKFRKLSVRVSLKGGTPEAFSKVTNALPEAFELPFQAIRNLYEYKIPCSIAAMSGDPRFMTPIERISLIVRLGTIDPALVLKLEEEFTILFPTTKKRLEAGGWRNKNLNLPFYLRNPLFKYVQISYEPVKLLAKRKISIKQTIKNIIQLRHGI
jgi:uncharacterized Fe-S cluster-containing radical SAM superfamily protein